MGIDSKNTLETQVYQMKNELSGVLFECMSSEDKNMLTKQLDKIEYWLEEEGAYVAKDLYDNKLKELGKWYYKTEPLKEAFLNLEQCCTQILSCMHDLAHISPEDKAHITRECESASNWLSRARGQEFVVTTRDVEEKTNILHMITTPILNQPSLSPPLDESTHHSTQMETETCASTE